MPEYVLALDFGTSAAHCLLVDQSGCVVAQAHAPLSYHTPPDAAPLGREFNPDQVTDSFVQLVQEVLRQAGVGGALVKAVGITGQRQGMALLDRSGRELYCGPNLDLRAAFQGAQLEAERGPRLYAESGCFPALLFAPARLRWLKQNRPTALDRASSLLSSGGWLAFRLTGELCDEISLRAGLGLASLSACQRSPGALAELDFPPHWLPSLMAAGNPVGQLRRVMAARMGLPPGLPITIAGADTPCGLLGMGLDTPGHTGAVLGWSGSVMRIISAPLALDGPPSLWQSRYPLDDLCALEANLGDTGRAYRWLLATLGLDFDRADTLAAAVPPGSAGAQSLLGPGARTAPQAGLRRGGLVFPIPLAYQAPTPGHLVRAFLEGAAYTLRANLESLETAAVSREARETGLKRNPLAIGGGLSRSGLLSSILPNALGRPVERSRQHSVSGSGAAAAAWASAGMFDTLRAAVQELVQSPETLDPKPSLAAEYEDYYQEWLEMDKAL